MVPPLNISKDEIDEASELLDKALSDVAHMPVSQA
jgi:4-aminobutyrate aminotransferase-like enzyme